MSSDISDEPIVIIYDGPENAGKTTIKRIVNEMIGHQSISFERWTGTQYAYARLHDRQTDLKALLQMDGRMNMNFNCIMVYLWAPPGFLKYRMNNDPIEGEEYKLDDMEIDRLIKFFNEWYYASPFTSKLSLDTSKLSPKDAARIIAGECETWKPGLEIKWSS
jgi:hypothetical protein